MHQRNLRVPKRSALRALIRSSNLIDGIFSVNLTNKWVAHVISTGHHRTFKPYPFREPSHKSSLRLIPPARRRAYPWTASGTSVRLKQYNKRDGLCRLGRPKERGSTGSGLRDFPAEWPVGGCTCAS